MLKIIILFTTLMPIFGAGQVCSFTKDLEKGNNLCNLIRGHNKINIPHDKNAELAIDKILSVIGARKKFVILQCDEIQNAVATSYKGIRYIVYDKEFMSKIANNTDSWSNLSILAHEVGHHVNGHSLDLILYASKIVKPLSLEEQRQQELDADEFSGFVLAKLGASLFQSSQAISLLCSDSNDNYSTHPSKSKRLEALKMGYDRAKTQSGKYRDKTGNLTSEDYFYRAIEKESYNDFQGALSDYSTTIILDNTSFEAYFNRGTLYLSDFENYNLAIKDFDKAISIKSDDEGSYYNRAMAKMHFASEREDPLMFEAINDFEMAIKLNPDMRNANFCLGMCKYRSIGWFSACNDFLRATELGEELPDDIKNMFSEFGCN